MPPPTSPPPEALVRRYSQTKAILLHRGSCFLIPLGVSRINPPPGDTTLAVQTLHPFAIDRMPFAPQPGRHALAAPEGVVLDTCADQRHQRQVLGRRRRRLVVVARPTQAQQFALPAHAQHRVRGIDPGALALN